MWESRQDLILTQVLTLFSVISLISGWRGEGQGLEKVASGSREKDDGHADCEDGEWQERIDDLSHNWCNQSERERGE
jgi:hypothetical protein